jgi:hypothetical protein
MCVRCGAARSRRSSVTVGQSGSNSEARDTRGHGYPDTNVDKTGVV